jgi:hypothetical protein
MWINNQTMKISILKAKKMPKNLRYSKLTHMEIKEQKNLGMRVKMVIK